MSQIVSRSVGIRIGIEIAIGRIRFMIHIFIYISNLVAKAPGLNLGKKLRNLLSNHEALN